MLRKQLIIGAPALAIGMMGYSTILLAAPLATVIDSGGASCISAGSEVDSLSVNDVGVDLAVNGSCSGGVGTTPSGVVDRATVAIDEGTSVRVDLGAGVTVKLPYTVTVATSLLGQTPTLSGTWAYYTAPVPGTVPVAGGEDSFNYTFSDATGTARGTVTIPINSVEPTLVNPTNTTDCVESATVTCKGALPDWPAGTLFYQAVAAGETHVWEVVYDKDANNDGSLMLFDGGLKTISISLIPNDFSMDMPCQLTQTSLQQPLSYASVDTAAWYQCGLEHGKKYFVNIKSTLDTRDPYTLTVL